MQNYNNGFAPVDRRSVLKKAGAAGGAYFTLSSGASGQSGSPFEEDLSVAELAMEYEQHPEQSAIAFTSVTQSEGYQAYLARGIHSPDENPNGVDRLTNAELGVHGLSWEDSETLSYSRDGSTFEQSVRFGRASAFERTPGFDQLPGVAQSLLGAEEQVESGSEQLIDSDPRPIPGTAPGVQSQAITTQEAKVVKCTNVPFVGDWCVRIHKGDGPKPTPRCSNFSVPGSMVHHHILDIMPKGKPNDGINIWVGTKNGCLWAGEENYLNKCWRLCKDGKGLPGLSTFVDHWEKILVAAAAAAGISMHSTITSALAYILGGLSVKPPTLVPV